MRANVGFGCAPQTPLSVIYNARMFNASPAKLLQPLSLTIA